MTSFVTLHNIFVCTFYMHHIMQDVALVSLANVLYRSGYDKDATAVIHMSLEVCQRTATCEVNSAIELSSSQVWSLYSHGF